MDELDLLRTLDRLTNKWKGVFSPEDGQALADWLRETRRDDPESVRQTANRALDLLQRYPSAKLDLGREVNPKDPQEGVRLLYSPSPGLQQHVEAHTRIKVCPKDPSHYQRRPMFPGERLYCPKHGVELVDPDSLPAKE